MFKTIVFNPNAPSKAIVFIVLLFALKGCNQNPSELQEPVPEISISVVPDIGTIHTTFEFRAAIILDGDTTNTQGYRVRWDWDGDKVYETPWLDSLTARHLYGEQGKKALEVQIQSPSGETFSSSSSIYVQQLIPISSAQTGVDLEYPDWSVDGSNRIAFTSSLQSHGRYRIAILQYPGGMYDLVTPDGTDSYLPEWSRDGNRIAFTTGGGLGILDLVTGTRTLFPDTFDERPSWSPDGRYIAYGNLLYDLADSITSSLPFAADIAWSPRGDMMALGGLDTLTIVAFPGYAVLQKHRVPRAGFKVEWSSNGRWISLGGRVSNDNETLFYLFDYADAKLYSWRPDGLRLAQYPTWSQDGTLLAFEVMDQGANSYAIWAIQFPQDLY